MEENEQDGAEQEFNMGDGALTQEALDALLAAADAEAATDEPTSDVITDEADSVGADDTEEAMAGMAAGVGVPADIPNSAVSLPSFDTGSGRTFGEHSTPGLTRVRDIPLEVTVELGRTRLLIKDILDLGTGSIIELDKLAGEPMDLFANGLLVARGEVIVIDDNFGVRVTEIITAADRKEAKEANALAA